MKLALSRIHFPVTALGPGTRVGIWFRGCSIQCPGCIGQDTWAFGESVTSVLEVVNVVSEWTDVADGVTISGGEPFDQSAALKALLTNLRGLVSGDILVYTGYSLQSISNRLHDMSGLIDAIITEPFKRDDPQTLPLRGSDNQMLHLLTPLARQRYANANIPLRADDKTLDIMFDEDDTVWIAGIPRRGDLNSLLQLLQHKGLSACTTEDLRGSA